MTDVPADRFPWRQVVVAAFLPTILFSIGEGAIIPIIPVVANGLGADIAGAALVSAMIVVGELLGDIPAGALVARIGERTAMIGASVLSIVGVLISVLAPNPWVLGIGILLIGVATAVFALARHAFMTSFVPPVYRARALSTLGGTFRFGYLVGPFVTAGVIQATGSAANAFWIHLAACLAAIIVLIALHDPEDAVTTRPGPAAREVEAADRGLFRTITANRRVLATLGTGSALVAALRASRNVILPLWAVSIGIDEATMAIIIGSAAALDFGLFYAGGWIMDRFGRLWTAVPSMIGLGLSHLLLAFTHDVPHAAVWFAVIAGLLSLSNGIGAGILMTLGADLADPARPAPFLGAWRFTNDTGAAVAPLLIWGVTAAASLPIAAGVMGVLGLAGALELRIFVPKYTTRRRPRG
ncbi:MFS transporter [Homoserinibacter gongjuensis]|uniref:MFS transporter n=1 Tax=Homoserinibacter gongjuensis TaxID=1162968 RepID=A0ABQ6JUT2_9MICO|nr:MFS transporter [Homoserinibacter gongjuensis]GMA92051.1 MFS transporter [Homoserinibacter gongjuensis]